MVDIEFSVTPVPLEDRYEITVTQTFETNVPAPVLIVDPPKIDLPPLKPGEVFNGEFKVTNYGLVAVFDVELEFPTSIGDFDIEVLTQAVPDKLGAMQSVTIPYKITRRLTTAGLSSFEKFLAYRRMPTSPLLNISSIFSLIGYVGTPCPGSFAITFKAKCIICPKTIFERIVEISRISHYIFFMDFTRDCTPFMTDPAVKYYPIHYWHQHGGGSPGAAYSPLGTNNPCNCMKEGTVLDTDPNDCKKEICQNGKSITVEDITENSLVDDLAEEKFCAEYGTGICILKAYPLRDEAIQWTKAMRLKGYWESTADGTLGNAAQHAYWMCRTAEEIDINFAKGLGDAHEEDSGYRYLPDGQPAQMENNPCCHKVMDLHNNEIGRQLSEKLGTCEENVLSAAKSGLLRHSLCP